MAEEKEKAQKIKHNPLYDQYSPLWSFYLNAYEGTGEFSDGSAIVKFGRESDDGYRNRKQLAFYPNFCAPIVDLYVSMIFKRPVQRVFSASKPLPFETFINDVDRRGSHLDFFMRDVATMAQVYGFCPVLVDMPKLSQQTILTKQDQIAARMMPYFVAISPLAVVDWSTDRLGELDHVLIREGEQDGVEFYRYIDRERIELIEKDKEERVVETIEHGLGIVPMVSLKNQRHSGDTFIGLSAIRDIARVNKRLMNMYSELDQILRNQTFSLLVLPYDPTAPSQNISIGTDNALQYNPDATHMPSFISPDASQGQLYLEAIKKLIEEIFRLARLEQFSTVRELSGVAFSYAFRNTNSHLALKADMLEQGETRLWQIWSLWQGANWDGVIHYADDFDIRDIESAISHALDLQALNMGSLKFEKAIRKQLANTVLDNISDSEMQQILEEIDSAVSFETAAGGTAEEEENLAGEVTPAFTL